MLPTDQQPTAVEAVPVRPPASIPVFLRRRCITVVTLLVAISIGAPLPAAAQSPAIEVVFSSPPSPVGAGARATGVGSAFIGLADDATAASWNPGGLTQLERPEMSAVARGSYQTSQAGSGSRSFETPDGIPVTIDADGGQDSFGTATLDYLSAAVPLTILGRNVVASINYQQMFSFDRELHWSAGSEYPGVNFEAQSRLDEAGAIYALTPALAVEVMPDVSIGAALNRWMDGLAHTFGWRETFHQSNQLFIEGVPEASEGEILQQYTFKGLNGINATFGLLWKVGSGVSIGAVGKIPFTAGVDRVINFLDTPDAPLFRDEFDIYFPATAGAGVSWRPNDRLTLSTDLTWVDWSAFRVIDAAGNRFLVTGDPADQYSVDDVFTPRVGAEYVWLLPDFQLTGRTGFFYDPEPARGSPNPFYGGSVGAGLTFPSFSVDLAYQLRVGLDAENTALATQLLNVPSIQVDEYQHLFYLSLVVYL